MSRENVKKFYELAENDMELAQKLASLDSEMSLEASDLANLKDIVNEKIIPLAKKKGLEFTAEEMVDFANEKYLQLSEDDLLDVSGGVEPKKAAWGLSTVLLLSLGSAAAINLMNSNQDNISNVVSEPSKTASEEKDESEDEEALKKSLDEMMKKSPKGADKNANMEDIEKELDKLFKGGKLGGGSAFRPGKGRTAGKNMLNRTIGKKDTSDFDFDKFLKELDDELAKEAATSQAAKPKATISETSNFDFDKFMEEINSEKKSETAATRAATSDAAPIEETTKPAPTATSARIEETSKPVPISKGTTKGDEKKKENKKENKKSTKISKKKNNEQQYKEMAQQQVNKRLSEFKAKFENSFKEKFKTQCDAEDLTSFVKEYLATPSNLDGGMPSKETVEFYYGFAGGSARVKVNVLDFAKELNNALPKMQYKPVNRRASWKDVMSHVMGALQSAKYGFDRFDPSALQNLQKDIEWICTSINKDGYLSATLSANYGKDANSIERKNIEYLKALKDSIYNKNDEKVQSALKELSSDELNDENKEQNISSGTEDKKAPLFESQEAAQKIVEDLAGTIKLTVEEKFNSKTQLSEGELQQFVSVITDAMKSDSTMQEAAIVGSDSVTLFAKGQLKDGTEVDASQTINVLELAKELNAKLPKAGVEDAKKDETEKPQEELIVSDISKPDAGGVSLSKDEATKLVSEYSGFLPADFTAGQQAVTLVNFLKKLGNVENLKLVDKKDREVLAQNIKHIYDQIKTDKSGKPYLQNFYNWSISADDLNLVGQAFEIVKDDFAQEENKDKLAKPQEALKEKPVVKADAGATVTTAKELQQQAEQQVGLARTELDEKFQAKIKANNGIELNEANLNKLISETLDNYSKENEKNENVIIDEKKGTITFTAKGTIPGAIWGIKAGVGSATLNVKEFFTKLNNEATEARRELERSSFVLAQYVTATESDVTGGLKLARETAKKMIREKFEDIIVAKYNAENPAKKATSVEDIPAVKRATIVKSLNLNEVISKIVKANIERTHDFKDPDKEKYEGSYSIKTAPLNEELKIGAIGYKLTGIYGFRQSELIKYGDEISIRSEVENLIKENIEKHSVSYKTVVGGRAGAEAEALYKFLTDNKLVENGTVVESVLAAIKDSDKEQFKKDVKHIADQISGSDSKYTLSGKWYSYNVAQEKLKAIKDLAKQLGD